MYVKSDIRVMTTLGCIPVKAELFGGRRLDYISQVLQICIQALDKAVTEQDRRHFKTRALYNQGFSSRLLVPST